MRIQIDRIVVLNTTNENFSMFLRKFHKKSSYQAYNKWISRSLQVKNSVEGKLNVFHWDQPQA